MRDRFSARLQALDGLRALAIALVVWHHWNYFATSTGVPSPPGVILAGGAFGFSGVFLFFVLSGFLLFLPYARALLNGQPWPSARQFYRRRALRILPAYSGALLVLLLIYPPYWSSLSWPNLLLLPTLLFDWRPAAFAAAIGMDSPFWTLTIECQFYLLLPWLALGIAKLAGPRASRAFLLRLGCAFGGLIIVGLCLRALAAFLFYQTNAATPLVTPGLTTRVLSLPGFSGWVLALLYGIKGKYLEIFALGMLVSVLYVKLEPAIQQKSLPARLSLRLGLLACIGWLLCFFWAAGTHRLAFADVWIFVPADGWTWQVFGEWALGCCFALLLLAVLLSQKRLRRLFSLRPLTFIGTISYSIYLWHWPILAWLILVLRAYPTLVLGSSALILACSTVSYLLLERPFLRHRFVPAKVRVPRQETSEVLG